MQQPPNHQLAQLNIGRIRYEIDDRRMADFTEQSGAGERAGGADARLRLALYRRERQLDEHAALCR